MAGSSTCLNAAVPAPLDVLAVTHYPHVVPGPFTHRDRDQHDRGGGRLAGRARLRRDGRAGPTAADYARLDARGRGRPARRGRRRRAAGARRRRADRPGPAWARSPACRFATGGRPWPGPSSRASPSRSPTSSSCSGSAGPGSTSCACRAATPASGRGCRIKADVLGIPVRTVPGDAAVTGVAMLAGLGAGVYRDPAEAIARCVRLETADRAGSAAARAYAGARRLPRAGSARGRPPRPRRRAIARDRTGG